MTVASVFASTFVNDLRRYARSWGLWLLLLSGPVGARFMIARDDGSGVQIAIVNHLPVMTSAMLGVSLGIVVSTLLLPLGFLYLRSNVTRRRPWQVEDVTAAPRLGIALGQFAADVTVLFGMLATLTLAGWFLGWLIVTGPLDIVRISWTLWLVAAPAVMGLAGVHRLFDALPFTRRAVGEALFFFAWIGSLAVPISVADQPSSFAVNMTDYTGFVRPLAGPTPLGHKDIAIGGTDNLRPGRVALDVMAGVQAPGYIASRITWAAIAIGLAVLAGAVYRPRVGARGGWTRAVMARLLSPGAPPAAMLAAPPAPEHVAPWLGLMSGEFRLVGSGRLFKLLAIAAALAGLAPDYRHVGSPAALLLLIFALVAQAGRSEAKGLLALTRTAPFGPWTRRAAFIVAAGAWCIPIALPASLSRLSFEPMLLNIAAGLSAAALTVCLATVSRSAFAPRLVLLVLWYAYLSS